MNWYTTSYIASRSVEAKKRLAEEDGCCEHVEADPSCATYVRRENDSCGVVSSYVCCDACNEKAEKADDDELVTCFDCKQEVRKGDSIQWKWYDFYAPQGDEPLDICNNCRGKEKHLERLRRDRADYEAEMARYDH